MNKFLLKAEGMLDKFSSTIVKGRKICLIVFIILTLGCACMIPFIKVEYDLTGQMPKDSYTADAIALLKEEFDDKGMAYVCAVGVSESEASKIAKDLAKIDGIAAVTYVPAMNYKNNKALYTVNLTDYDSTKGAFETVESVIDYLDEAGVEHYLTGQSAFSYFTKVETEQSIIKVGIVIVVLILGILLFTSKTYFEMVIMIIVFVAAVAINMGTNMLFGGISYLSNLVSLVLQLALSLDYMVILLHRYMEERELKEPTQAAAKALSKGIVEILSGALTTIGGLGSLLLMSMPIGVEIGLSLGKSIIASLVTVVFFMPALLVMLDKPLMNSKHKSFVPKITRPAKAILKGRKIIVPLFVVIIALSFVGQLYNTYSFNYNGGSMIVSAREQIEPEFGTLNSLVIVVPKGDAEKERELANYVASFDNVDSVNALSTIELVEGIYLTDEIAKDDMSTLMATLAGGQDLGIFESLGGAMFDGYLSSKGITNPNTKVRIIDLLEYVAVEYGETLKPALGEYGDLLDSLSFAKSNLESENYSRLTFNICSDIESEDTFGFLDELGENLPNYYTEFYMTGESVACYDMASYFTQDNLIVCLCSAIFVLIILLFTFKNLLLPIVLLLAIQGGIWINFAVPFITSTPVAFIGYLLITAMQMGATIDYAIVITNRYREIKGNYLDRYEAMADAQNTTFPTIITSGLILTGTGFALSLLTTGTVGAMGSLLGVGALTSLLIVLFILPSLLLVSEKLVDKCDFNKVFKKKNKATPIEEQIEKENA
ncbi:MAG: MMPL family transporter [Clostridia bacterium]|nr:MMPL family transporter [Clostridia bacterium]